jgi:crotonobetainyl-CoA:carnitine CoA-transferase CaiB-like acyl-CoA transferase
MLGEHTVEILGEICGYDSDRIAALVDARAIHVAETKETT